MYGSAPGADASPASVPAESAELANWLANSVGLNQSAMSKVLEVTGAESISDLSILSQGAVEAVIADVGLKLVGAEKLRRALAALQAPKAEVTAAVDTTAQSMTTTIVEATPEPLQEAIAICIDRSGSMGAPFAELHLNIAGADGVAMTSSNKVVTQRERLEAVKAMFYAFRDRIESLGSASVSATHELGLLQFDNQVETLLGLTAALDRFECIVDEMKKRGTTAIYSAIVEATRMLQPVFECSGDATDLRILVLTDGSSNAGAPPEEALAAAHRIGAIVDAIIVGDQPDANLRKIVAATGGLCFQMRSLGEGFELLESEAVASLKARRGGGPKPKSVEHPAVDFSSLEVKKFSMAPPTARSAADVEATAKLARVVDIKSRVAAIDAAPAGGTVAGDISSASCKRILKELRNVASTPSALEGVHIFPSEADLRLWKALIEGPAGSPFEGGTFALSVNIPADYPLRPPHIRFETPVYHCNVNDSGAICLQILHDGWTPSLSVPRALESVRQMLATPDTENALRQWIAELTISYRRSGGSDSRYVEEARRRTAAEAGRTLTDWHKEWSGSSA